MRTFSSSKFLLWIILVPMLLFQLLGATLYFFALPGLAEVLYPATKILMIVWPVLWFAVGFRPKTFADPKSGRWLFGLSSGAAFSVVIALVFLLFKDYFESLAPALEVTVRTFGIWDWYIPFAVILSLGHSLFEEVYWRWFVFGGLRLLMPVGAAMVVSSLAFASHHVLILWLFLPWPLAMFFGLCVAVAGMCWCMLYQKTNSLITSWLSHILVDVTILAIGYGILF
ncbi:CPBP family intramembrane metalloprotease [Candidatus Uhrbacteria bacterium]|nr:CPBP family intramembrane metalloprotease [Candidatus Uhrbacteria bacterium]